MSTRDAQRLAAGLEEDEEGEWWHELDCAAMPWGPYEPHCCYPRLRQVREVTAKRQILALYEEFAAKLDQRTAHPQYAVEMVCEVLESVVGALAGVYQDAPAETGA